MNKIENILQRNLFSIPLLILLSTFCLGLFNSDWYSLIYYLMLLFLIYSSKIITIKKNWLLALLIAISCLIAKHSIQIPKISEGSNIFIGGEEFENSIFKEKLPSKIFLKLYSDYSFIFPDSISGPDQKLYDIAVSQMIKKNNETPNKTQVNNITG